MTISNTIHIRWLGKKAYTPCWEQMKAFTETRDENTADEIWLVEHEPVFTQGQNGQPEHVLNAGNIPIVKTDRGGQVTYHGPGQLMMYTLVDIKRRKMNVRDYVCCLEKSVIALLADLGIQAYGKREAPGVYVHVAVAAVVPRLDRGTQCSTMPTKKPLDPAVKPRDDIASPQDDITSPQDDNASQAAEQKICSIGLRIKRGASYHGIALNVDMDLEPFDRINPCGFSGLKMTQISALTENTPESIKAIGLKLTTYFVQHLGYTTCNFL